MAVLYVLYAATLKRWNYSTEKERIQRRGVLKQHGMSNTFYFIHTKTLFVLNVFSGGLFTFYWLFKQWQAVRFGFRRVDGKPLKINPLFRTLLGFITFFELNALINRTCEYTRRPQTLPLGIWGMVWLGGLMGCFFCDGWNKIFPYLLWCYAPSALQDKVNGLTPKEVSPRPKLSEMAAVAVCISALAAGWVFLKTKGF